VEDNKLWSFLLDIFSYDKNEMTAHFSPTNKTPLVFKEQVAL
jgi:hypothetical protein